MPQKKPYLPTGLLWIETSYRCSYSSGKWWRLPSAPWLPSLHHLSISNHAYTLLCFLWPECFEASWGIKKKTTLGPILLPSIHHHHACLLHVFNASLHSCLGSLSSCTGHAQGHADSSCGFALQPFAASSPSVETTLSAGFGSLH